jgi:GGDEF domain-containing protein
MESPGLRALIRLVNRRFGSFSEATDSVLDTLEEVVPGTLLITQMDADEGRCRVIEVRRGAPSGLERGSTLPLARLGVADASGPSWKVDGEPDVDFLRSIGLNSHISAPIEVAGGQIAGSLYALAGEPDAYGPDHAALLGLGARLLSYERESTQTRAEMRRLKARVSDGSNTDSETGLPNRDQFFGMLDHTWGLVARSLVNATIVTCHVPPVANGDQVARAAHRLAVKEVGEVMAATIRATDHVGRVNDNTIGAVLVGCQPKQANLFVERFRSGLSRVTRSRRDPLTISCGIHPLEGTESAAAALGAVDAPTEPFEPVAGGEVPVPEAAPS